MYILFGLVCFSKYALIQMLFVAVVNKLVSFVISVLFFCVLFQIISYFSYSTDMLAHQITIQPESLP